MNDDIRLLERATAEPAHDLNHVWVLFHENSKIERYTPMASSEQVVEKMRAMQDSVQYPSRPVVPLAEKPLPHGLDEVLTQRVSERAWGFSVLTLPELSTVLQHSYGVTRDNDHTEFVRPFRAVPSGGGLYPLEVFVSARNVEGLAAGFYHYSPHQKGLVLLKEGDQTFEIAPCFVQQDVVIHAAALIVITAIFSRTTFKYGNRGYRFALIEAGHLAQNANVVATAMGCSVLNMGGFFDRDLDDWLGFDGLTQSALYATAVGRKV